MRLFLEMANLLLEEDVNLWPQDVRRAREDYSINKHKLEIFTADAMISSNTESTTNK